MPTVVVPSSDTTVSADDLVDVHIKLLLAAESFAGIYDRMEIWRSKSGASGPYEEITADTWLPARVPAHAADKLGSPTGAQAVVSGLELLLELDEREDITITFTGSNPLTFAQAAAQVELQGLGKLRSYVDPKGLFVIATTRPGLRSALKVVGGNAAPLLGLVIGASAHGRDPRIPLLSWTTQYDFTDPLGRAGYFYKRRLHHSVTGALDEFSSPFSATGAINIPSSDTISGFLDIVGSDGRPLPNTLVVVHNKFQSSLVDGRIIAETDQNKLTDKNGRVEFILARGLKATVSIAGTSIVRDIVVPTDAAITTFNLLGSEASATDDVFKVQRPVVVSAERRSW